MKTYKQLYDQACKKGKLRKDEYTTGDFIDDVNDLARTLWTTIFQGVNGNRPNATRTETFTVSGDLDYVATRTIKKTPILKIYLDGSIYFPQRTDQPENTIGGDIFSFEYDDDEIRFKNSVDGDYIVYYEGATYTELTSAAYTADASPDWIKDDFITIFWSYPAFLNTDTRKQEMGEFYQLHLDQFRRYYSRTETLEDDVLYAEDSYNQL